MNTQTPARPSFWSTVGIVAKREIVVRCMSKSFIISTLITLAVMFLAVVFTPQIGKWMDGGATTVATTTDLAPQLRNLPNVTVVEVADPEAARSAVLSEDAKAAVVPDASNPLGIEVLSLRDAPTGLLSSLSVSPNVQLLDPNAPHPALRYFLGVGFGMVWMMAAIVFGMGIANSVVEEKQTRIVEILLASISSKALLTGKIIGNSAAALAQILAIAATVLGGLAINGSVLPVADLVWPIVWFVVLFLFGFVMIAALYAAAAALVSRTEDLNTSLQPLTWLVMLPYLGVAVGTSNPLAMTVMSYIPFSAPVAVPVRIFLGQSAGWEPFASLALLVLTTVATVWFAARIYDRGLLRTGKPMKWREAIAAAS